MKRRLAFSSLVTLAFSSCATHPPAAPAISPEAAATQFTARSLNDAGLRHFLVDNLGQEPTTWDLETLSWVAFYFNPSLDLARAQWARARAGQQTAAARPNPTISLVPGYNSTREPGLSPWFPAINFDFLFQGNKRAHQQDIARADAEVARLAVLGAAWQVRSELRRALLDLRTASARAAGLRKQVEVQSQLAKLITARFEAGSAGSLEASIARLATLRLRATLADASAQAIAARARVGVALGLPLAALDGVDFSPPIIPALSTEALASARRESLQSRADVLGALAKVQSAHAALELEYAKQQPDFHLGPGYQWDQGLNKWSLSLTFELPIFHRNEGPIAEATARRAEAVAQFTLIQSQVIAAIDGAVAAQAAAAEQIAQLRALREEVAGQSARVEQRLALGGADQVEHQNAALEIAVADLALADAMSAAALAGGQLEDALQIPFPHLAALADAAHPSLPRTP